MKKQLRLFGFAICLLPSLVIAQEIEWQNTIGGSSIDFLFSIHQTADGGYILGGWSMSDISGDKTENCIGNTDYWIIKTDAAGTIQWENTIGGTGSEILTSIQQTADGGFIIGGYSQSGISNDKTENSIGGYDYWIVKTDTAGAIQWQNTIGGTDEDYLTDIEQTFDGGYLLCGYSLSDASGDKTENTNGLDDIWIVKTDASGVIQWQNSIGGSVEDIIFSSQQTTDGGYILGGYSHSDISGDKTENSNGSSDYWIIKTNAFGVVQWQNTIGGNNGEMLSFIQQTTDGGFILAGRSLSDISGDKTEVCNGQFDFWLVKTDGSGNILWQNTIGGIQSEYLNSLVQTTDGGYILGGSSNSDISGDKTENNYGSGEFWIIKTDESGDLQWQNSIGGIHHEEIRSIQHTADGGFILGGTSGSDISGDKSENSNGDFDFWMVKITDHYNLITGNLFVDANSNNIKDIGELPVINKQVVEFNTNVFGFSGQTGNFCVAVLDSGSFSVSPSTTNYYNVVPVTHTVHFTGIEQTDSLNDFALQPAGVFNDLCVVSSPLGPFRAGFDASYLVTYQNVGTTTLNPTVIFYADDDLNIVSSVPVANIIASDSLVWNFGPLAPFQTGSILVTVNVNIGTPIGTLINSGAVIEPIAGDANTQCNQSFWEVFTIGSSDPNDILVDQDSLLTTQFPAPPYLEYIIRFQNTGNDTAFTVKVLNPIDTFKLELNTFEFVTSSHPVNLTWVSWERNMQFQFDNILLPDSNVNEPASHGFIRYRIKPKSSLVLGDTIANNTAIYFDFNAPVITNTAFTEVVLPTSIPENATHFDNLVLYPNPAHSTLTVVTSNLSESEGRLTITDVTGRILYSKSISRETSEHNIEISSFARGVYFVQLQSGERFSRGRFVKE